MHNVVPYVCRDRARFYFSVQTTCPVIRCARGFFRNHDVVILARALAAGQTPTSGHPERTGHGGRVL
jgi:hypothetical protein